MKMSRISINFNNLYHEDYNLYNEIYIELANITYNYLNLKEIYEISVILVDNDKIFELNSMYRQKDYVTDVISFENEDRKVVDGFIELGDIFISVDKAIEQSIEYNHSILREMSFLFVHGLLHCLGYNHINEKDEEEMFKIQEVVLNEFKKNN